MFKRMSVMLLAVALVVGAVYGWHAFTGIMMRKYIVMPTPTVATATAEKQEWRQELKAIGSLRAVKGVDLAPEVGGVVEDIHFESGAEVEEGTLLLQLRSEEEMARLRTAQANVKLAETTYQRDLKQLKAQAISQATVDTDAANLAAARAQVAEQRALIEKKIILAPFTGRIGLRSVDVGQYLAPGTTVATLQQLDPLYLDFTLPQQALTQLSLGQAVTARTDAYPDQVFEGTITALNAKVDPATRNITVRATLANPDHRLLPGMYATVSITTGAPEQLLTLPQTAITYNPYGNTVYVVESKGANDKGEPQLVATQHFVTLGPARGDQVAVLSGLQEGNTVVSAGQMKLQNGSPVKINNSVQPSNEAEPKVEER